MLIERAAEFERLEHVESIWQGFVEALEGLGLEFLIYLTVDRQFGTPMLLSTIPEIYGDWPPEQDPFLHHCCDSYDITLTGGDYLRDYAYLPHDAQRFIEEAAKTGFRTGIGIPMRLRGSGRFGGFNLGTRLDREGFEAQILPRKEELRLACLIVHRRIEELSHRAAPSGGMQDFRERLIAPEKPTLDVLTQREQEVAYLIASGFSRKECARLCDISPNTVSDYVKSIYQKLEVHDRMRLAQLLELPNMKPTKPTY
ncbi:MAG: LuxR C-terminal-related transcriptional regulator [Pseudomonadota bacterium]